MRSAHVFTGTSLNTAINPAQIQVLIAINAIFAMDPHRSCAVFETLLSGLQGRAEKTIAPPKYSNKNKHISFPLSLGSSVKS